MDFGGYRLINPNGESFRFPTIKWTPKEKPTVANFESRIYCKKNGSVSWRKNLHINVRPTQRSEMSQQATVDISDEMAFPSLSSSTPSVDITPSSPQSMSTSNQDNPFTSPSKKVKERLRLNPDAEDFVLLGQAIEETENQVEPVGKLNFGDSGNGCSQAQGTWVDDWDDEDQSQDQSWSMAESFEPQQPSPQQVQAMQYQFMMQRMHYMQQQAMMQAQMQMQAQMRMQQYPQASTPVASRPNGYGQFQSPGMSPIPYRDESNGQPQNRGYRASPGENFNRTPYRQ